MAVRSEQLIALSTTAANREKIQERKPVLRSMKEGWLHEEECLEILQGSTHIVYRKITYNWLVFNTEYFYRGEVEISRTSYEEVRRLFN